MLHPRAGFARIRSAGSAPWVHRQPTNSLLIGWVYPKGQTQPWRNPTFALKAKSRFWI